MNSFEVQSSMSANLVTLIIELNTFSNRYHGLYPGFDVLHQLSRAGILSTYEEGHSIQWREHEGKVTASIELEKCPDHNRIMELCKLVQGIYTKALDEFLTIMKVSKELKI